MDEQNTNPLEYTNTYSANAVLPMPQEVKRWNWGAFMLNIYWGIGNRAYLTLLCLIPFFNIVWIFICGAKGNEWAWKEGNYKSSEEFFRVQDTWNRAGFVAFIITIVVLVVYILFFALVGASMMSMMSTL